MADPWMKFFTNDWVSDPRLRMCSLAARGLWIEMICIMHESDPYGHLLVFGLSPTDAQLAVLVGAPPNQIPELIGELEQVGVFSRTRKGVVYSRKMTRDHKKAVTARKNGKNGGNPSLRKETENMASVKGKVNGALKTQKPEPEPERDISSNEDIVGLSLDDVSEAVKSYNVLVPKTGWPKVTILSKRRRSAIAARIGEHGIDGWRSALNKAAASGFLTGQSSEPFFASFDWMCKPANLIKVIEGNYDNRKPSGGSKVQAKIEKYNRMGRGGE